MPAKYELIEIPENHWGIKLLETKYAGVTYRYGQVKFLGEDEQGNGVVHFEYEVLDPADFSVDEIKGDDVDLILGEILQELIIESLKEKEKNEIDRKDNPEESDSQ